MSYFKKFLKIAFVISILVLISLLLAYYLIVYKPNVEKLEWVSNIYEDCMASAAIQVHDSLYVDLYEVMSARHSADKLEKYLRVMQGYSQEGVCDLSSTQQCLDTYLYVSRSFLVRGNEQDVKDARGTLKLYSESTGKNLYYGTVSLAIMLLEGRKLDANSEYYNAELKEFVKGIDDNEYFSRPHDQRSCHLLLDHIGATYARMGEYSSDLFITTYLIGY